jgi:hypothetical protein
VVFLRELRDLPMSLLNSYLGRKPMYKFLHSQPVKFAWRGAAGFGLSFILVNLAFQTLRDLFTRFEFNHNQAFLLKPYQSWFLAGNDLLTWIIASLIGGFILALFFSDRGRFVRFMLLATLCWCIPGLVNCSLTNSLSFSSSEILSSQVIYIAIEALTGAFLGIILEKLAGIRWEKILLILAGALLYPLLLLLAGRWVCAWFPAAHSLITLPAEAYRNMIVTMLVSGSLFGIVMGFILGSGKQRSLLI